MVCVGSVRYGDSKKSSERPARQIRCPVQVKREPAMESSTPDKASVLVLVVCKGRDDAGDSIWEGEQDSLETPSPGEVEEAVDDTKDPLSLQGMELGVDVKEGKASRCDYRLLLTFIGPG